MDAKGFKKELEELLKRFQLFPQQPGRLTIVCNTTNEMKFGEIKVSPEIVIR